jgi:seryl-tRNA synthetase
MYDLPFFRTNLQTIAHRLADRGYILDLEAFRALDSERRAAVTEAEQLKAQRNSSSQEIAKQKREGVDTSEAQQRVRDMGERMTGLDERVKELDEKFRGMLASVPNTPHESVPVSKSAEDNVEVRRWGTPTQFDFQPQATGISDPP